MGLGGDREACFGWLLVRLAPGSASGVWGGRDVWDGAGAQLMYAPAVQPNQAFEVGAGKRCQREFSRDAAGLVGVLGPSSGATDAAALRHEARGGHWF